MVFAEGQPSPVPCRERPKITAPPLRPLLRSLLHRSRPRGGAAARRRRGRRARGRAPSANQPRLRIGPAHSTTAKRSRLGGKMSRRLGGKRSRRRGASAQTQAHAATRGCCCRCCARSFGGKSSFGGNARLRPHAQRPRRTDQACRGGAGPAIL